MTAPEPTRAELAVRASRFRSEQHAAICEQIARWEHGTVVRASRYPSYHEFNLVRVEREPAIDADALSAFADRALAGLAHRRLDFDHIATADRLRADLHAKGFKSSRVLWLRLAQPAPVAGPQPGVEHAPYAVTHDLRAAWHAEDSVDAGSDSYLVQAAEVARRRRARLLIMRERGRPVAFLQYERSGEATEITHLFVLPAHRSAGRGTALIRAAIELARGVRDLWICADDEDRPKKLYERLGFEPVWTTMQLTRVL